MVLVVVVAEVEVPVEHLEEIQLRTLHPAVEWEFMVKVLAVLEVRLKVQDKSAHMTIMVPVVQVEVMELQVKWVAVEDLYL
jgi:hypothetical protein